MTWIWPEKIGCSTKTAYGDTSFLNATWAVFIWFTSLGEDCSGDRLEAVQTHDRSGTSWDCWSSERTRECGSGELNKRELCRAEICQWKRFVVHIYGSYNWTVSTFLFRWTLLRKSWTPLLCRTWMRWLLHLQSHLRAFARCGKEKWSTIWVAKSCARVTVDGLQKICMQETNLSTCILGDCVEALDGAVDEPDGDSDMISEQDSCKAEARAEEKEAGTTSTDSSAEVSLQIGNIVFWLPNCEKENFSPARIGGTGNGQRHQRMVHEEQGNGTDGDTGWWERNQTDGDADVQHDTVCKGGGWCTRGILRYLTSDCGL